MATRFKFTVYRGGKAPDVTVGAGDTVGTDSIVVNIDATALTKDEAITALEAIQRKIIEGKWFPL